MRGTHPIIRCRITAIATHFPTENNTSRPGRAKTASKDFKPTTANGLWAQKTDGAAFGALELQKEEDREKGDPR